MKDRIPGAPGQFNATVDGSQLQKLQRGEPFTITLKRDDQPIEEGTPYSKAAVLPDALATRLCPGLDDPSPADAFAALADKITNKPERVIATPSTLKDILSSARAGTIVELAPGNYPRLDLVGINAYPENLTITGTTDAKIAGVSITSGIKDQEINSGWRLTASRGCKNADISNAILPKGLTFKNICFTNSFSLRNGSIDNLTIDNCLFLNGAFINHDPNRMDDLYGSDFYTYDANGNPVANFYTRPYYAKLLPKNLVIKNNTFNGLHNTSDLSAIRIQTVDGIVVYKNTINSSRGNGINIGGVNALRLEHYATGKISITNNFIQNTASRSIRLYTMKDADIFIAANSMSAANTAESEKNNPEVIKLSDCRDTFIRFGSGSVDGNFYQREEISVDNNITLQDCKQPECIIAEGTSGVWTYRKWSNGFAECWTHITLGSLNIANAWGTLYESDVQTGWEFPFNFTSVKTCVTMASHASSGLMVQDIGGPSTNKSGDYSVVSATNLGRLTNVNIRIYAAGTYK